MRESRVAMMLSHDPTLIAAFATVVAGGRRNRLDVVATIEDACARFDSLSPTLIVVDLSGDIDDAAITQLLWRATRPERALPVLVVSATYSVARATTLFRLGVADYLSMADHRDRIDAVVSELMGGDPPGPGPVVKARGKRIMVALPRV